MGQKSLALATPRHTSVFGAWLAVLALAIQCLVIQPHIDASFAPAAVQVPHASAQLTRTGHETQGVCVICQAMATAGALTLSASPALTLVERTVLVAAPARHAEPSQRARSHNWQSRAPPQAT